MKINVQQTKRLRKAVELLCEKIGITQEEIVSGVLKKDKKIIATEKPKVEKVEELKKENEATSMTNETTKIKAKKKAKKK